MIGNLPGPSFIGFGGEPVLETIYWSKRRQIAYVSFVVIEFMQRKNCGSRVQLGGRWALKKVMVFFILPKNKK